jgi:hypothetical protein
MKVVSYNNTHIFQLFTFTIVCVAMGPNLPFIMQEFLNLTNEIDIDTLSSVMGEFVEVFAEQLTPFAVQLCSQLRDTFLRIMEELAQTFHNNSEMLMKLVTRQWQLWVYSRQLVH